jgi:hypothetical protein
MNYYQARQRKVDNRWDYSCRNDDRIWPVGYCAKYRDPEEMASDLVPILMWRKDEIERIRATKDKYHTDGHATAEEACECYRQYLLDHKLRLDGESKDTWHKCLVCETLTNHFAEIEMQVYVLCDKYRTREEVEKLFGPVGESISSY